MFMKFSRLEYRSLSLSLTVYRVITVMTFPQFAPVLLEGPIRLVDSYVFTKVKSLSIQCKPLQLFFKIPREKGEGVATAVSPPLLDMPVLYAFYPTTMYIVRQYPHILNTYKYMVFINEPNISVCISRPFSLSVSLAQTDTIFCENCSVAQN